MVARSEYLYHRHIFQNALVTSNKMVHKKRHHFLAQFSIPFHMVWSVLLRVLAQKTPSNSLKFFDSQSEASIQWFLKLTLATKRSTPCERVWKTVPENGVFSCVPFCLKSLGQFARCAVFTNLDLATFRGQGTTENSNMYMYMANPIVSQWGKVVIKQVKLRLQWPAAR